MAQTTTPAEPDKPEQVAQGLKLVDPETASQPIKNALALLPVINVFRAQANFRSEPDQGNADSEVSKC